MIQGKGMTIDDIELFNSLKPKYRMFVIEYVKDLAPRRAATASGFCPDTAYDLLKKPEISECIDRVLMYQLKKATIDGEWILNELVDNHRLARYAGNLGASNSALKLLCQHKSIDAFAAAKQELKVTDGEVIEKLNAARKRVAAQIEEKEDVVEEIDSGEVSFL